MKVLHIGNILAVEGALCYNRIPVANDRVIMRLIVLYWLCFVIAQNKLI